MRPLLCRVFGAAMISTMAVGVSAAAQTNPAPAGLDPAPCRDLLSTMAFVEPATKAQAVVTRPDERTCVFAPMRFGSGRAIGWAMESLTIQGLAPTGSGEVRIAAHAIHNAPAAMPPISAYIAKVGAIPFDVDIEYHSDPRAGLFTLDRFSMRGQVIGDLEVTAALTGIAVPADPLASTVTPPNVDATALKSFTLLLENHGFVERMVTPFVAGFLAASAPQADPEAAINAQKLATVAMIRGMLPAYGVAPGTVDALARFVSDFPHPTGKLQCSLQAEPPLRMPGDATPPDPATIKAMVAAGHPTCSYDRS